MLCCRFVGAKGLLAGATFSVLLAMPLCKGAKRARSAGLLFASAHEDVQERSGSHIREQSAAGAQAEEPSAHLPCCLNAFLLACNAARHTAFCSLWRVCRACAYSPQRRIRLRLRHRARRAPLSASAWSTSLPSLRSSYAAFILFHFVEENVLRRLHHRTNERPHRMCVPGCAYGRLVPTWRRDPSAVEQPEERVRSFVFYCSCCRRREL